MAARRAEGSWKRDWSLGVLWWPGCGARVKIPTQGPGLCGLKFPTGTKDRSSQASSSACPDIGQEGTDEGLEVVHLQTPNNGVRVFTTCVQRSVLFCLLQQENNVIVISLYALKMIVVDTCLLKIYSTLPMLCSTHLRNLGGINLTFIPK